MWSKNVGCLLFLSDFNNAQIFSTDFRKILKYQISWKSIQWGGAESFHADQWRTEGGLGVQTPPTEIPKALQNRAKLKPTVKTVKNCWI